MLRIRRSHHQWLAPAVAAICLVFLMSSASATQLRIQPGDIVCTISSDVPVTISPDGGINVTITDSETCLPQAERPGTPVLSREIIERNEPGRIRLTWSSSESASTCEATSTPSLPDWTGNVPLGAGQTRTITDLSEGNYVFSLTCSNSAGTSESATVSGTIFSSSPSECEGRLPPEGWTRLTNGCKFVIGSGYQGDCTSWDALFGGGFTEVSGGTARIATNRLDPTHYLALQFSTQGMASDARGSITSDRAGGMMELHRRIYSISSCPGDFDSSVINNETGCYGQLTSIRHLRWGGPDSDESCQLEPNKTYYLNLIGTDSPLGTSPDALQPNCSSNENCGAVYDPQQRN